MKSVVAEASSIAKALELAWQKAGQPKEFLVKVFQEPQRNIFGLTKTSAKVGIFFDDAALVQKVKNATTSTQPTTNTAKQVTPITPIKPINNRPQVSKPAAPKQVKTQPKTEVAKQPNQVISSNKPVNEQVKTTKPVNQTPRPANNRRNNQVNRPVNTQENNPLPNQASILKPEHLPVEQINEQSLVNQVINLIAQENANKQNLQNPTANTSSVDVTPAPRPARNKYYRRRKPKNPRSNTGEGSEQNKPAGPVNRNED